MPIYFPLLLCVLLGALLLPIDGFGAGSVWLGPKGFIDVHENNMKFVGYSVEHQRLEYCIYVGKTDQLTAHYKDNEPDLDGLEVDDWYCGDPDCDDGVAKWGSFEREEGVHEIDSPYWTSGCGTFDDDHAVTTNWTAPPTIGASGITLSVDDHPNKYANDTHAWRALKSFYVTFYNLSSVSIAQNASGGWSATHQPNPVAAGTNVTLRGVIRILPGVFCEEYFWGYGDGQVSGIGNVYAWPSYFETPTKAWYKVEPTYTDRENTWDPTNYAEIDYTNSSYGSGWSVNGPTVGVMRYAFQATMNSHTDRTPDSDDQGSCGLGDECIDNDVMRIIRKGNYQNQVLQWSAAQIDVPFIWGSHCTHQVERYIGVDCAVLVGFALRKLGSDIELDPSASSLYDDAVAGNHGLSRVTAKTTLGANPNTQIPQPQAGDIVLIDRIPGTWPPFEHATMFITGSGPEGAYLDSGDTLICADSLPDKVRIRTYSGYMQTGYAIAVIRYTPE